MHHDTASFLYRSEAFAEDLPEAPSVRVLSGPQTDQPEASFPVRPLSSIDALVLFAWPLACALLGVTTSVWARVP
jgi:hypothetical protein